METLILPVREDAAMVKLQDAITKKTLPAHLWGMDRSVRPLIMEALRGNNAFTLVVTYDEARAEKLYDDYRFFDRNVYIYPAKDALFYYADVHGNATARKRLEIIKRINEGERSVIITTVDGLMDKIPSIEEVAGGVVEFAVGDSVNITGLKRRLSALGYENMPLVEGQGQFCVRGGIIDIFPITEECPYRIELWGDEIDSIRSFDAETQRSIEEVKQFAVYPASEYVMTKERIAAGLKKIQNEHKKCARIFKEAFKTEQYARLNKSVEAMKEELEEFNSAMGLDSLVTYFYDNTVSFLDYIPKDSFVFIDEPDKVKERARVYAAEFAMSMDSRLSGGYILPGQADVLYDDGNICGRLALRKTILLSELYSTQKSFDEKTQILFESRGLVSYNNSFENLMADIGKWRSNDNKILIISPSATRGKRIAANLNDNEIPAFFSQDRNRILKPKEVMITTGSIEEGYEIKSSKLIVISESDIFSQGKERKRKKLSKYQGEHINALDEISVGDYVVHERHGIGVYRGIEKVETEGRLKDYINIEYADGGKLFIPVEQLEMIGKYAGKEAAKPKLNKLGGAEWSKVRQRVKLHVDDIAAELIDLYAARSSQKGHAYAADSIWQREFEELFPYEETPDQKRAIEETKRDMESDKIMDRLICGDVGFGKTEVAIRAAFKAVQDSRQVAYLVPTTILAQQHYETFVSRMKNYPVNIKMLSRFCTPKEIRETLAGMKNGTVDIVIGTHRLLSKDVEFKALGLLIIDEEQRFGVKHKEKIKQMKKNVDVLTLTATPIPRTLHMSLIGLRDMSLLEEAPVDRRAIQTYVMEYDKEFVKEACNRELVRGGQVYYVYNRVEDIESIAYELRAMLPSARIEYAHGKMNERELERIMHDFINREIDILVSTTIIETGLDIPNVNTIIIHDADKFGLSQLYQLRGRVGRSNRSAYAFLMYRRDKMIKEVAQKRLKAIREFTDLGSGYKISMKDLEIRGAGNLLGADQSGHMEAVGYDLYCKMLNDSIKRKMGQEVEEEFSTSVDLPVDAYIPDNYVRNEFLKLELYKRISKLEDMEDYDAVLDEAKDRFGEPPKAFIRLLCVAYIKSLAHKAYMTDVKYKDGEVQYLMKDGTEVKVEQIPKFIRKYKGRMRLVTGRYSGFSVKTDKLIQDDMLADIESVIQNITEKLLEPADRSD